MNAEWNKSTGPRPSEGTAKQMELPQPVAFELDLCSTEAVTNIIAYAYEGAASHCIRLRLQPETTLSH